MTVKKESADQNLTVHGPEYWEEKVKIRLFKDNDKYKDDVFVAVNGERIQIKRGETVEIKRKFAEVLEQSMAQDMSTAKMIEDKSTEFERQSSAFSM